MERVGAERFLPVGRERADPPVGRAIDRERERKRSPALSRPRPRRAIRATPAEKISFQRSAGGRAVRQAIVDRSRGQFFFIARVRPDLARGRSLPAASRVMKHRRDRSRRQEQAKSDRRRGRGPRRFARARQPRIELRAGGVIERNRDRVFRRANRAVDRATTARAFCASGGARGSSAPITEATYSSSGAWLKTSSSPAFARNSEAAGKTIATAACRF